MQDHKFYILILCFFPLFIISLTALIASMRESKTGGKGLFLMAEKVKDGLTTAEQINALIER